MNRLLIATLLLFATASVAAPSPSGKARVCKTLITGSNPVGASTPRRSRLWSYGGCPSYLA